ncbi:unnamed protein product, partial [Symbiodinium microadriaticum]
EHLGTGLAADLMEDTTNNLTVVIIVSTVESVVDGVETVTGTIPANFIQGAMRWSGPRHLRGVDISGIGPDHGKGHNTEAIDMREGIDLAVDRDPPHERNTIGARENRQSGGFMVTMTVQGLVEVRVMDIDALEFTIGVAVETIAVIAVVATEVDDRVRRNLLTMMVMAIPVLLVVGLVLISLTTSLEVSLEMKKMTTRHCLYLLPIRLSTDSLRSLPLELLQQELLLFANCIIEML